MKTILVLLALLAVLAIALGRRRMGLRLAALAVLGAVVTSCVPVPGSNPAPSGVVPGPDPDAAYVAIGDSYASGEGSGSYLADTDRPRGRGAGAPRNLCRRSGLSYPYLVAHQLGQRGQELPLVDVACSGATTADVLDRWQFADTPPQIDALHSGVQVVTIQVGGNDLGFGAVLDRCVDVRLVHARTPCADDVRRHVAANSLAVTSSLERTFGEVRRRSPNAIVLVIGYPSIFELDELPVGTRKRCAHVRRNDVVAIIEANAALNRLVEDAAVHSGFAFVSLADLFDDHGLCGRSDDWINGISLDVPRRGERTISKESVSPVSRDSFHPSPRAHEAIAETVVARLDVELGRTH